MEWLRKLGQAMIEQMRRRPGVLATAAAAVAFLGLGIVSCQTGSRGSLGRPSAALGGEPEVRVRIKGGATSVKISGAEQFALQPIAGDPALMDAPLTVTATERGLRFADARGVSKEFAGSSPVDVVPAAGSGSEAGAISARVQVDGMSYPGNIRVVPRGVKGTGQATGSVILGSSRGVLATPEPRGQSEAGRPAPALKLDVIEHLPMETYLAGVVGAELYKEWPLTAFQVQAVCARTYALHERERSQRLGRDYDLESTTADQAYAGGAQLPVALQAVKDTRGVAITWQGRLLRAYYSSTCGGRTASAADIWPTGTGYEFNLDLPIQSHHREAACQASPRYRWEAARDRGELSRRIREWGKNNGHAIAGMSQVSVLRVAGVNRDERPNKYEVEDDKGRRFTIACEELRQACGQTVAGLKEIPKEQKVWASDFEFDVKGATVTIRGRGFGHGVGMCQFCTKAFADRGDNWRDIVLRYYPGAKLERAY